MQTAFAILESYVKVLLAVLPVAVVIQRQFIVRSLREVSGSRASAEPSRVWQDVLLRMTSKELWPNLAEYNDA